MYFLFRTILILNLISIPISILILIIKTIFITTSLCLQRWKICSTISRVLLQCQPVFGRNASSETVLGKPAKVDDVMHTERHGSNASSKTVIRLPAKVDDVTNMERHGSNASSKTVIRLPAKVDDVTNIEY